MTQGRPLQGIRVLDFTRILSGPYCTLLLSDMGADVIKVERPPQGDDTRTWGPPFLDAGDRISTYFAALNRGKRSIHLDLTSDAGQQILRKLIPKVDIVVENFRPGVARRLGLDHDTLRRVNPTIVTASISGFGSTGAYAGLPGTEIIVEAMSGLMYITGPTDGDPVRFGIAMIDISTGLTAAARILGALLQARISGTGAHIECSLYATSVAALATLIASYSATGEEPTRWGSHHPSIVPYGGFRTADGHILTGAINDAMWPLLCEALEVPELAGRPELQANAGRVEHRRDVEEALERQCATRPTEYWITRLRERGLLGAPIRTVGEAVEDPATRQMNLFVELKDFPGVLTPRLDGVSAPSGTQHVPRPGEHTQAVLAELDADFLPIEAGEA